MIVHKKQFITGAVLLAAFCVVLVLIFLPLFDGQNSLNYMDDLFNSISKGSAYYIDGLLDEAKTLDGNAVDVTLEFEDAAQAVAMAPLFAKNGATALPDDAELKVTGDLGDIMTGCLDDADRMFANNGAALSKKYGSDEKKTMYNWWKALKAFDKALKRQEKFAESKFVTTAIKKGVECSYNFYGIEPQKISEQILVVLIALVFYVVYTMWYGFAIMFMFEGWGLKLEDH